MLNWNEIENPKTYSTERAGLLVLLEGSTSTAYVDSVGDPTIGIGFNLVYNLAPVLRVIVGSGNWSDALLARLEAELDKSYTPNTSSALQANLDRVMQNWHDTKDADVPESFRFRSDAAIASALDALAPGYDDRIDAWLDGIPDSRERKALFSLCWNGPSLLGPKLKAAIEAGDRAEAWYEIRYNSNGNGIAGLANRRYAEAETFGLFDTEGQANRAEMIRTGQMLARHHETILRYEDRYDPDTAGTTKAMPGIDPIHGEMAPAIRTALKFLGLSAKTKAEELLAVGDGNTDLSGDGTSYDNSMNDDDLMLGSKGADALSGKAGADVLAGLRGADTLTGGSGSDIFAFTALRDSKAKACDTITDFGDGADRVALSAIGPVTLLAEEGAHFTGHAEARWFRDGNETIIEVDADGDGRSDMQIVLKGALTLGEEDFLF